MDPTHRAIDAVAREAYGRLLAFVSARTRDVAAAEDALGDAFVAALATWPRDGVPQNPGAWLLTAARRRLIDQVRVSQRLRTADELVLELIAEKPAEGAAEPFPDERLNLMFVCAHPAIDPAVHTPLMLQTVLGLDAARIARAFLVSPTTLGQRLVRAKAKIRDTRIAFEVPEGPELPRRLDAVLGAIYTAYGSGWEDAAGVDTRARGLAEEALWLARVLVQRLPGEPEARGLLALILHCEARRPARRTSEGHYVALSEQDTGRWSGAMMEEAERELATTAQQGRPGRFQLEAAIQSVHADRARTGRTDWVAIATFYEHLVRLVPTVGVRVGRAAAVAEVRGPVAGLALLDEIDPADISSYQPFWAVRAHLLARAGRLPEARAAFTRAIDLAEDDAVRRFLLARRA
jgi:RNA polymerase sigma-70 factor (ECF subfamily)